MEKVSILHHTDHESALLSLPPNYALALFYHLIVLKFVNILGYIFYQYVIRILYVLF